MCINACSVAIAKALATPIADVTEMAWPADAVVTTTFSIATYIAIPLFRLFCWCMGSFILALVLVHGECFGLAR